MIPITSILNIIHKTSFYAYFCPVCQSKLSHFNRFPDYYIDMLYRNQFIHSIFAFETLNVINNTCPICHSGDANRLYALYFRRYFKNISRQKKINFLDFAPIPPLEKYFRSLNFLNYRTADLLMNNVDDNVDITDLKIYKKESIDIFLCSHILEHVPDDGKALAELFRILSSQGWGIIMVPILLTIKKTQEKKNIKSESDRWKYYGQGDHVRIYSKNGFMSRLKKAGFKVTELNTNFFGRQTFEINGISERSVLYLVSKNNITLPGKYD